MEKLNLASIENAKVIREYCEGFACDFLKPIRFSSGRNSGRSAWECVNQHGHLTGFILEEGTFSCASLAPCEFVVVKATEEHVKILNKHSEGSDMNELRIDKTKFVGAIDASHLFCYEKV